MPQISIIIPIYNAAKTLEDCLQSIFSQTFKHYEIIAVNDGSTDSSAKILEKYKNKLTLITQKNEGAASARNAGAKAARGEFIIFCDSDV
ncbi:glycosyltransferase family 2 protein, partial [Candidatus Falkowbacteria bacterium]|nr:glycosyltransferase family 2 protein [Candidatus Falkowbacteria bacterium]